MRAFPWKDGVNTVLGIRFLLNEFTCNCRRRIFCKCLEPSWNPDLIMRRRQNPIRGLMTNLWRCKVYLKAFFAGTTHVGWGAKKITMVSIYKCSTTVLFGNTTQLRFLACSRRTTCHYELEATYSNWFVVASCPACGMVPHGREPTAFMATVG